MSVHDIPYRALRFRISDVPRCDSIHQIMSYFHPFMQFFSSLAPPCLPFGSPLSNLTEKDTQAIISETFLSRSKVSL